MTEVPAVPEEASVAADPADNTEGKAADLAAHIVERSGIEEGPEGMTGIRQEPDIQEPEGKTVHNAEAVPEAGMPAA